MASDGKNGWTSTRKLGGILKVSIIISLFVKNGQFDAG